MESLGNFLKFQNKNRLKFSVQKLDLRQKRYIHTICTRLSWIISKSNQIEFLF